MSMIRPGGQELSREAYESSGLKREARILDVGTGEGDALAYLSEEYDVDGVGIDLSPSMIAKAKQKHTSVHFKEGDAEFLEFESKSFDGVFMECVLSLVNLQIEAIHEAYCVLKSGGKLIISDLYARDPDPEKVEEAQREAFIAHNRPREEGDCEDRKKLPSMLMLDGVFIMDALIEACEEMGFKMLMWEDKTDMLRSFVAEQVMEHGSLQKFIDDMPDDCFAGGISGKGTGYFLLILEKQEAK